MGKGMFRRMSAFVLAAAMLLTMGGVTNAVSASAGSKTPKLNQTKVTVNVGASKKVKLKNKPAKAKVQWSSQNKKIAKVNNGKITGVKAGKTTVICKVTSKKTVKKLKVKVTVKAKKVQASESPTATNVPQNPVVATPTAVPQTPPPSSNLGAEHLSANGITTRDNGYMRANLTATELMKDMGYGWNLGNQMEQSNWQGHFETVTECETSAGNPVATQKTFDGLKSYGIKTVRVPVAWSNFISEDGNYTLNENLMNRVEEIINYALNNQMYVIINIHWDGAWWGMFGAEEMNAAQTPIRDEAWKKYRAIWTQIAERYKEYSDYLIFEGANEELSGRLNDDYKNPQKGQANQTGKLSEDDFYAMANAINQEFVNIVRSSGGNNKYRQLLIPGTGNESCVIGGYETDTYKTDGTMDERFKMPTDIPENGNTKLNVSVHVYDPTDYGLSATSTTTWGYRDSWGTPEDYVYLDTLLARMQKFTGQGYGVIVGECGCVKGYKDNVIDYMTELFTKCREYGYCPVMWDEGHYYEREKGYFSYGDVGQMFAELTGSTPTIPSDAKLINTGISVVPTVENTNPKVVYTWEGEFMRHTGDGDIPDQIYAERGDIFDMVNHGIGITTSITDAEGNPTEELKAVVDREFWNIHFKADWSKIEKPCIRVYPADNEVSQSADLQIGYIPDKDGEAKGRVSFDVDYDQMTGQMWVGKYIELLGDELKGEYPWLWVTTNTYTGASYVKVEICDGAYNADGTKFESKK